MPANKIGYHIIVKIGQKPYYVIRSWTVRDIEKAVKTCLKELRDVWKMPRSIFFWNYTCAIKVSEIDR